MPRPRDPENPRIESDRYRLGYARALGDQYVIFVSTKKIYTGLKVTPANVPAVKRMIDIEVERRLNGASFAQPYANEEVPSLFAAALRWREEFIDTNPQIGESNRRQNRNAIEAFTVNTELPDMPLGVDPRVVPAIVERFARVKAQRGGAISTTNRYLQVWKRIFAWSQQMGWLTRNPIELLSLASEPKKPDEELQYSRAETAAILREARRRDPELYRLFVWLGLTGMRIAEALDMRWSDITEHGITIRGKGHRGAKRVRHFPLRRYDGESRIAVWMRRIHRILEAQRVETRRPKWRSDERVWRWTSRQIVDQYLMRIKEDLKIPTSDGRSLHTFRKMAANHMRRYLYLPKGFRLEMCGHSGTVYAANYEINAVAEEVAGEMDEVMAVALDRIATTKGIDTGRDWQGKPMSDRNESQSMAGISTE